MCALSNFLNSFKIHPLHARRGRRIQTYWANVAPNSHRGHQEAPTARYSARVQSIQKGTVQKDRLQIQAHHQRARGGRNRWYSTKRRAENAATSDI